MRFRLIRSYGERGVNGKLYLHDQQVCYTIELPWKNNQAQISCIPEGIYPLQKRYSPRFGWHLQLQHVPGRSMILIHPANHAMLELRGCIAPVSLLTGAGRGRHSVRAMQRIMHLVDTAIRTEEPIFLIVSSKPDHT